MVSRKDKYIKYLERINLFFMILLGVLAFLFLILYLNPYNLENDKDNQISIYESNPNCSELNLEDTAKCLNERLSSFYFFNETQTGKNITEKELEIYGGVCEHASIWYTEKAQELGFYTETPIFYTGENSRHEIAIISNEEGYCVEDQKSYSCWRFLI